MGIRTGICSFGMSGKLFHAPFIHAHPGYELTAIVERSKNESGEKYPDVKIYRSVEELIADKELQLIIVNTPTHSHYDFTKAALEAGKHVVVEKPFVVRSEEGEELAALAAEKDVVLSVYQNRRYDGDYRAVKNIIDQNILGDLVEVQIRYDRYRPTFSGKQHKEGGLPGSGTLYDLGAHLVDQALQLFGWPDKVFCDVTGMREGSIADDYFELLLYYEKMRVRLASSVHVREPGPGYIIHGKNGSFIQKRSDVQEQKLLEGVIPSRDSWCLSPTEPDGLLHITTGIDSERKELTSNPGNYMNYYEDVFNAISGKASNPVPAEDGIKTIRIIEAGFRSAAEERIIKV